MVKEERIPTTKSDEEIARSLELGLEAAGSGVIGRKF